MTEKDEAGSRKQYHSLDEFDREFFPRSSNSSRIVNRTSQKVGAKFRLIRGRLAIDRNSIEQP